MKSNGSSIPTWMGYVLFGLLVNGGSAVAGGELPELSFVEANLDFGTVDVGSPGGPLLPALLTNVSDSVTATGLSFDSDAAFPIPYPPLNPPVFFDFDRCWELDWILAPGESCFVILKFVPPIAGPLTGTLTATSAEGAGATLTLSGVGGDDVMLHGQPRDWATMNSFRGWLNASFAQTPGRNSEVADDFLVTDPEGWTISKVGLEIVWGMPFFPEPGSIPDFPVDVHFMPDDGGEPGADPVCSALGSQYLYWEPPRGESRVEITLSAPCTLPPGHYWLRVDVALDDFNDEEWLGWGVQYVGNPEEDPVPPVHLNHPMWRNSGGSFGHCLDWTPLVPPNCGIDEGEDPIYGAVFWLIGQGQPASVAELTLDPTTLDFGEVEVGTTSPPLSAILENTGDVALTGLGFSMDGGEFEADTGDCGTMLAVGESCQIGFTCTPVAPESASGIFEVTSDQEAQSTLDLSCEGVTEAPVFTPMMLEVDPAPFVADGNGVFEPGELVEVAPVWRNDSLVLEPLAGTASNFSGTDGAVYFLTLDNADYGNLEPGATSSCRDTGACYWLAVSDPATRPATHWDATFDETLDDSEGTGKTWSLHIGDSFIDVPRASQFYSWIETLLHNRVTGGCTGTTYCPSTANTRDQMPVFLLKALEGGAYTPPACTGVFNDVPCPSLFANWIEDLVSRGVTAGCGGGNYCPSNPVSRDQMAVFLLKTLEGPSYAPPACTGAFGDVPCPSLFANWVEDLVAHGITAGCGGGNYCPSNPVSRDQMAVFLAKTFGLTLYGP